jgi:GntR family transcriptional regulator/MocR family aminotransferase
VRRCRTHYRRRRDRVIDLVTDLGGELAPAGIAAGLHVVVLLGHSDRDGPIGTEVDLLARAERHALLVEGLSPARNSATSQTGEPILAGW